MAEKLDFIIFTDGSVRRDMISKKTYAGYGVVMYDCSRKVYASFGGELGSRSISFSESYAIQHAIGAMAHILHGRKATVLIVSDSKLCISSYTQWYHGWIRNAIEGIWVNTQNRPVQNQVLMKRALAILEENPNMRIHYTHVNSHMAVGSSRSEDRILRKLRDFGFRANKETADAIIHMNAMADEVASKHSYECKQKRGLFELQPTQKYFNGTEITKFEGEDS